MFLHSRGKTVIDSAARRSHHSVRVFSPQRDREARSTIDAPKPNQRTNTAVATPTPTRLAGTRRCAQAHCAAPHSSLGPLAVISVRLLLHMCTSRCATVIPAYFHYGAKTVLFPNMREGRQVLLLICISQKKTAANLPSLCTSVFYVEKTTYSSK